VQDLRHHDTRSTLLMQIGDEAAKQARESLARLKKDPAKR